MAHTKSEYNFVVQNPVMAEQVIQSYLMANGFVKKQVEGLNYFEYRDPVVGKRGFEYYINGCSIIIKAYMGTYKKCSKLEGFVGCAAKIPYKNNLDSLFSQLQNLNNYAYSEGVNTAPQTYPNQGVQAQQQTYNYQGAQSQQPYDYQGIQTQQPDALNTFLTENNKKKETYAIIAFIVSLVGLLLSFTGFFYGAIVYVLVFYFAILGLKTRKRGLAIASLAIASVSIAITIFTYFAATVLYKLQ